MVFAGRSRTRRFSRRLYPRRAVEKAAAAHAAFAAFILRETRDHLIVRMSGIHFPDPDRFVKEFANYALGMTKRCLASG